MGHWFQRDHSLHSVGTFPGGLISLRTPRLPDNYLAATFEEGGFPATEENLAILAIELGVAFLLKAEQFIGGTSGDGAAAQFGASHRAPPRATPSDMTRLMQTILDDLVRWNVGVLPYIQDTPTRLSALLLELNGRPGTVWERLNP